VRRAARIGIIGSALTGAAAIVVSACASSEPNAIGTLPILNTIPRTVPVELQTTTTAAVEVEYTVQRFDTLFEIARAFGVTMDDLAKYNNIGQDEYDSIQAGQVLKVPNPSNPSGTFAPQ
jgi:LysM repeat protein